MRQNAKRFPILFKFQILVQATQVLANMAFVLTRSMVIVWMSLLTTMFVIVTEDIWEQNVMVRILKILNKR